LQRVRSAGTVGPVSRSKSRNGQKAFSSLNINNEHLKGEYKGMSLGEVCKLYSAKNGAGDDFHVKGYKVPK